VFQRESHAAILLRLPARVIIVVSMTQVRNSIRIARHHHHHAMGGRSLF
jgi:hypothetical protein